MILKSSLFILFVSLSILDSGCSNKTMSAATGNNPPPPVDTNHIEFWLTKGDQSALLQKQTTTLSFGTVGNAYPFIDVDTSHLFQNIDGFGYTLTGGSADVINGMNSADKSKLLMELFGKDSNSIGISYLRISIGASDLNASVFSYDDMPAGQTDTTLDHFSLDPDKTNLIPLLKEILLINPEIKILATPWSPPVWMKDNGSSTGGSLKLEYYDVYARYFVKYIKQMLAEGIIIDAVTPQNEPLHPGNNPSLLMPALQETNFIKNNLGPAFQSNGITTRIIIYDHNCDRPDYPLTILNDASARTFVIGSAFHLYAGDISALSQVHNAYPDKNVYFTEQYTATNSSFDGDLNWHTKNLVIGATRNWSRTVLEWNLANDPSFGPHTPGGCTTCKGALTIGSTVTRNVAYYIIGQASKFVSPGSARIESNIAGSFQNVAFRTPAGKIVLIVLNDGNVAGIFNTRYYGKWFSASLPPGAVGTFMW